MTDGKSAPCMDRIDARCFGAKPKWAKQAFAYRLLHTIAPQRITRRLPRGLNLALLGPGVILPEGAELLPGTVVPEGVEIPPDYSPDYPEYPGIFPPPWVPPESILSGVTSPLYLDPATPGPINQVGKWLPTGAVYTAFGTTADGNGQNANVNWTTCRTAASAIAVWTTYYGDSAGVRAQLTGPVYVIRRAWLMIDLTSINPGKAPKAVALQLTGYLLADSTVCVQQGTQGDTLTKSDWCAFTGSAFGYSAWSTGTNLITFNTNGMNYVQGCYGSICYLCLREYTHDYLDSPPAGGEDWANGFYFQDDPTESNRPQLLIEV